MEEALLLCGGGGGDDGDGGSGGGGKLLTHGHCFNKTSLPNTQRNGLASQHMPLYGALGFWKAEPFVSILLFAVALSQRPGLGLCALRQGYFRLSQHCGLLRKAL